MRKGEERTSNHGKTSSCMENSGTVVMRCVAGSNSSGIMMDSSREGTHGAKNCTQW